MGQQPKSTTHFNISHPSLGPPKTPLAERQAWHSSTANGANKGLHRHQCRLLLVPLAIRWGGFASTWSPRYDWNKEAQRILLPWISTSHVRYWQNVNLWRANRHYNKSLRNSTPDILSQDLIARRQKHAVRPLSSVSHVSHVTVGKPSALKTWPGRPKPMVSLMPVPILTLFQRKTCANNQAHKMVSSGKNCKRVSKCLSVWFQKEPLNKSLLASTTSTISSLQPLVLHALNAGVQSIVIARTQISHNCRWDLQVCANVTCNVSFTRPGCKFILKVNMHVRAKAHSAHR